MSILWPRLGAEIALLRGRRLLRMNTELEQSGIKVDILYPDEMRKGRPGIALPGQLDKIISAGFGIDLKSEIEGFHGAPRLIAGTRRYEVRDALIHRSTLYRGGYRKIFNVGKTVHNINRDVAHFSEAVIRSSFVGCHFFGHWLTDDCATALIEGETGTELTMPRPRWPDTDTYNDIFGIHGREVYASKIKRLVFFDDIGHNPDKVRRQLLLRDRMNRHIPAVSNDKIIYIRRGKSATSRALVNEDAVVEALAKRGIASFEAETSELPALLSALSGARMLISVEGSQIAHSLPTLQQNGSILAIQPPDRFFLTHMDWTEPLGMNYGVIVGDPADGGFTVGIDDLLRTIDLL